MVEPSPGLRADSTLRLVVLGLVIVAVLSIVAVSGLSYTRRPVPESLIGIGSAAVGALSTLLARVGRVNGANG
jgi:hypothetical protein